MTLPTVVHLVPTISRQGGGVAEAARLLIAELEAQMPGHVEVLATRDEGTARDLPAWPAVPITLTRFFGSDKFRLSPGLIPALWRTRADIVHLHALWAFPACATMLWAVLRRRPVVITVHGMLEPWILARSRPVKRAIRFAYQDRLIARAACLHVLTEKERADVALSYPRARVVVLPNFVELPRSGHDPGPPGWWRPEFAGRDVYLFLGRLHEKKGCLELIAAWSARCAADPAFRERSQLVFCGWNDGLETFDRVLAEANARHGNLLYAGPTYGDDKARTMAVATFFVLPSKSEGLPMTILEAWAVGAVVIMTPECNLAVGFERDAAIRTGTAVEAIDASLAVAGAASPAERQRLIANGRALVAERYAPAAVTAGMIALYRAVAAKPA